MVLSSSTAIPSAFLSNLPMEIRQISSGRIKRGMQRMNRRALLASVLIACWQPADAAQPPDAQLPAPKFHHLQLNSVDPDAAVAFYVKQFPSTSKTVWEGMPALATPNNVLIVFNKTTPAPDADPNVTAYWHFGWSVTDSRKSLDIFHAQN